jgi:hypothetical protein
MSLASEKIRASQEANHNWMSAMMTVLYVYEGKEGECRPPLLLVQKPSHAGLFVTKMSKASPKLFLACATGLTATSRKPC